MTGQKYGKIYERRIDIPIGLTLAIGYLFILLFTTNMGFARDEGYYFHAGQSYITWVEKLVHQIQTKQPKTALTRKEIRRYWEYNYEHPPLAKLLMGGSWWLFSKRLGWMSNSTGFRFPGMMWGALMILLIYIWGTRVWNRRVGFFAAFAMMLIPRFFFHSHLAAFDVPIASLWLLVSYAFWRGMKSQTWGILCGVFFGLALATKHNAWVLPLPLGLYWLFQVFNKFRFKTLHDGSYQLRFVPLPTSFYSSLFLGPLILFGLWPLLWPANFTQLSAWKESWGWLVKYVQFHLHHVHYDAYYFGFLHLEPPFPIHFPFGMTFLTFPLVIALLSVAGVWFTLRQQRLGMHVIWWGIQGFKWLLAMLWPILGFFLTLALYVPVLLLSVLMGVFYIIELLGMIVPGGLGEGFRRGFARLRQMSLDLLQDLRHLNQWRMKFEASPREYRPRPVGPADKTNLFWLLNAFVPIALIALPSTPIFGGTKHWMPAWPFLALLAAVAFERMLTSLYEGWFTQKSHRSFQIAIVLTGALLLLPSLIGTIRSHPHGLAYYNTLVGGPRGSANWKLQRSFWGFSIRQAFPWMRENLKGKRASNGRYRMNVWVDFHDTNWSSYRMYCRDKITRCGSGKCEQNEEKGVCLHAQWAPNSQTRYFAFVHQKWLRTQLYHVLSVFGTRTPVYGVYLDDAPLLTIWEKQEKWDSVPW